MKYDSYAELAKNIRGSASKEVRELLAETKQGDWSNLQDYIARYQAGEPGMGEVLLKSVKPLIYKMLKRWQRPGFSDSLDLVQVMMMGALEGFARFRPEACNGHPLTYIWSYVFGAASQWFRTDYSVVRTPPSRLRKGGMYRKNVYTFTEMAGHISEDNDHSFDETLHIDPEQEVLTEEELRSHYREMLNLITDGLTKRHRLVLRRRFWEGKTLQEIGDEFGMSREGARLNEARALLLSGKVAATYGADPQDSETFEAWMAALIDGVQDRPKRPRWRQSWDY